MRKIYLLLLSLILLPCAMRVQTAGAFEVTGGISGTDYSYSSGVLTINTGTALTISNTNPNTATTDRIVIGNNVDASLTFNGVNISAPTDQSAIHVPSGSSLEIVLADNSTNSTIGGNGSTGSAAPAIRLPDGATLTIEGSGTLNVTGGSSTGNPGGTGIGGYLYYAGPSPTAESCGTVIILSGTVTVTGGSNSAGIGGATNHAGTGGNGGTVVILSSSVTVTGGSSAVAIGGGNSSGSARGNDGQGIRPVSDQENTYTVWGDLTLPEGVAFPENITLNIPNGTTLNLPEDFTWPEGIEVTGEGTITPDNKKLPATITLSKDILILATGNEIELVAGKDYTYSGDGTVTITWYEDKDATQKLQGAPKGGRFYWIEMSAEATNLYQAVSQIEEVEVKKGGHAAEIPTVSQTKAGSITVNTVSGQKYICTTSNEPPSTDDSGWIDGTGETYTFENLQPATQYYIHTYFIGNDYLATSSIVCKDVKTLAEYTITFDSQGGSEIANQTVEEEGKIAKPENPTLLNHIFNGWYSDEACTTAWDFNTVVSESMTLYAKWTELFIKAEGETEISLGMDAGSMTLTAIIESDTDLSAGGDWSWDSSDDSVATVDEIATRAFTLTSNAIVTAKEAGTTTITATYTSDNYTGSVSYELTVTAKEEPDTPVIPDMPEYYNIMVEECEGVTVETSSDVVREGTSMTFTVDVAEGYTAENMTVKVKRSLFGTTDVIEPNDEGIYEIKNIYSEIYITVDGVEEKEETPTGMEKLEGAKVYAKEGSIYVETSQQEQVTIVTITGAIVKKEQQIGLQRYDLPRGIYVICIGEEQYKVRN